MQELFEWLLVWRINLIKRIIGIIVGGLAGTIASKIRTVMEVR